MKLGDGFLLLATWAWLTFTVGPVWVGVTLFVVAMGLNGLHMWLVKSRPAWLMRLARRAKP